MTAFSHAFRSEVMRMARKEIKAEVSALRKTVSLQRSEIVTLKREVKALAAQSKAMHKAAGRPAIASNAPEAERLASDSARLKRGGRRFQFDPQALAAKREQLGITQQAMATLLEASALSLSRWEAGKVTPRAAQLERIQLVMQMGKRAALAKLGQ